MNGAGDEWKMDLVRPSALSFSFSFSHFISRSLLDFQHQSLRRSQSPSSSLAQLYSTQMAAQDPNLVAPHSAQVVGNAFVEQYYQVLHQSPAHVFKFYQDLSFLSRPDSKGNMSTVTTMQAINDKILSLNYEECTVEIETADAQDSYNGGVLVAVTGYLTEKGSLRRKFSQTFFLAPQEPGYYVLNDLFRYVDDKKPQEPLSVSEKSIDENPPPAAMESYSEPALVPNHSTIEPTFEEVPTHVAEIPEPAVNAVAPPSLEKEIIDPPIEPRSTEARVVVDSAPPLSGDAPKISYASVVKVMKAPSKAAPVYVPTKVTKTPAPIADRQPISSVKPASSQEAFVTGSENVPENNNTHEEVEGHSIYVRNLPLSATVEQLQDEFQRFGPIKHDGIQVRSHKGFCFGFVEFELQSSVQNALSASPILIGDRKTVIEEKRTTTRVGNNLRGSGRPNNSTRGGYRSESFRGHGNFTGGRGYGRSDFRNAGEFSGRSRGPGGRSGGRDGYQWVNQTEASGRGGRQGAPNTA